MLPQLPGCSFSNCKSRHTRVRAIACHQLVAHKPSVAASRCVTRTEIQTHMTCALSYHRLPSTRGTARPLPNRGINSAQAFVLTVLDFSTMRGRDASLNTLYTAKRCGGSKAQKRTLPTRSLDSPFALLILCHRREGARQTTIEWDQFASPSIDDQW